MPLGQVDRDDCGGTADSEAEDGAADDHDFEAGGEDDEHDADEEHDRQHQDGLPAADGVGESAADEGADGGGED